MQCGLLVCWDKWIVNQASDVPSIFFFMISCRILCKSTFNLFVYFYKKNTKIKVKSFECPKSIKSLKKIILGTSDAWSTIRLSNRPSDPAWIYLRLTDFKCPIVLWLSCKKNQWKRKNRLSYDPFQNVLFCF